MKRKFRPKNLIITVKSALLVTLVSLVSCGDENVTNLTSSPSDPAKSKQAPNISDLPEGATTSSGGDGILCRDQLTQEIKSIRFFDFVESEELANRPIDLKGKTLLENLKLMNDRYLIDLKDSFERIVIESFLTSVESTFVQGKTTFPFLLINEKAKTEADRTVQLKNIDDDNSPITVTTSYCRGAKIVQIAATDQNSLLKRNHIRVDKFYFDRMSPQDQAGLLFHEFLLSRIYSLHKKVNKLRLEPITFGDTTKVREFVSILGADRYRKLEIEYPDLYVYDPSEWRNIRYQMLESLGILTDVPKVSNLRYNGYISDTRSSGLYFLSSSLWIDDISTSPADFFSYVGTIAPFSGPLNTIHFEFSDDNHSQYFYLENVETLAINNGKVRSVTYSKDQKVFLKSRELDSNDQKIHFFEILNRDYGHVAKVPATEKKNPSFGVYRGCQISTFNQGDTITAVKLGCLKDKVNISNLSLDLTFAKHSDLVIRKPIKKEIELNRFYPIEKGTIEGIGSYYDESNDRIEIGAKGKCTDVRIWFDDFEETYLVRATSEPKKCPKVVLLTNELPQLPGSGTEVPSTI